MFYGNIDMYYYKYNTSSFPMNKRMSNYLRFYQDSLIKNVLKKETPKVNTFMKPFPPIEPNTYLILFHVSNILAFLAGYYSHYFLNM